MQFLSRSKLQLQNRTCKPGAIFTAICRRDIAGVSNMFETWCNFGATKIASSCRDNNRLCKRAFTLPHVYKTVCSDLFLFLLQILEITLLMASYINAIIRQKGITCEAPGTPATRQGVDLKVWDLESAEWPIVPGSTVGLLWRHLLKWRGC